MGGRAVLDDWRAVGVGGREGASCLRKLADVTQVGVIEDDADALQGVGLPDAFQLDLDWGCVVRWVPWRPVQSAQGMTSGHGWQNKIFSK